MRTIRLFGVAATVAAFGCQGQPATTTPTTTPSDAAGATASMFDALRGEARRHVPIEGFVTQENIVSDMKGAARTTDLHLLNAWGLAFNPAGPAWVSSNGNGTAQVYDDTDPTATKLLLEVTIPPPMGGMPPSAPTGQIFNQFAISAFGGDLFLLATEDGTIAGWQRSDDGTAVLRADNSAGGAVYKGITIATPLSGNGKPQLYATDFHNNKIDVWDQDFMPVTGPGNFTDPNLPDGFAPFNIFGIGPLVLVTYAKQDADAHDDVKGPGNGFLDLYSAEGFFLQRLVSRGQLNSPWGMVFAPDKDQASIDLVVGNFGDGMINVYNLALKGARIDARWEGALGDASTGKPLVIDGLWALVFGSGKSGFEADEIYFTAGPNDEADGLFGSLDFTGQRK